MSKRPSLVAAKRAALKDERRMLRDSKRRKKSGDPVVDSFQNFGLQLGMGTPNALSGSTYGFNPITRVRTLLEWIYRGTWIGGVAVNHRAEDMTRAGIQINAEIDPTDVQKIQTRIKRTGSWTGIRNTKKWASLYGGAIGVILIEGQDPSTPLRVESVGRGGFKGICVLDRWMVDPSISSGGLVTEAGPKLGQPKFFNVRTDASMFPEGKIHYSRCLRLLGDEMPYWQSVMENSWGTSVYERIYDRLVAFDSATQGAAQTVYKSYVRTMKVAKLREIVTGGGAAYQGMLKYLNMMKTFQGIEGVTLIDGSDDMVFNTPSVQSGISEALVQFGQQLCGALRQPAVRLFGMSPSGLNSSGESDWRNYYDSVLEDQETDLREFVDLIVRVTAQSEGIKLPEGYDFSFVPLWQMSAKDKAEVADVKTRTVLAAFDTGLYGKSTALKELRQQSDETGVHTNVSDEDISEAEKSDKMNPPGLEALGPNPEGGVSRELGASPGALKNEIKERGGEEPPPGQPGSKPGEKSTTSEKDEPLTGAPRRRGQSRELPPSLRELAQAASAPAEQSKKFPALAAIKQRVRAKDSLVEVMGFPVVIESKKGEPRWTGGDPWPADYGYIRQTHSRENVDGLGGDQVDCFIGDDRRAEHAYVVNHYDSDGVFEEHKVMFGYPTEEAAVGAYSDAYGGLVQNADAESVQAFQMDPDQLRRFLSEGDSEKPLKKADAA